MTLLTGWPALTDDLGNGTSGTPLTKTGVFDVIKSAIEAVVHSTTNPTVTPEDIIDEVIAARGSKASLDARLDISLNDDGTPKASGFSGYITTAQLQAALAAQNLLRNGDLRNWISTSVAYFWTFAGAGGTCARTGSGEGDTFSFNAGRYAAKMTRAGTDLTFTQSILDATRFPYYARIKGRKVSFFALGKTAIASHLRLKVDDGVATTTSSYHSGGGTTEALSVVHTVDANATKLDVVAEVKTTNGDAYVGGFVVVVSDIAPSDWILGTDQWYPSRVIHSAVTDIGNVGSGEDTLHSYTLSPDVINASSVVLHVVASFVTANNANAKTLRFKWNGVTICTANLVANSAAKGTAEFWILSTGTPNTQAIIGYISHGSGAGAANYRVDEYATGAATETAGIAVAFTGEATSNDDIIMKATLIERNSIGANLGG